MTVAVGDAKLPELVKHVQAEHDRIDITDKGQPVAVLISPDDLEALEETIAVLSDPEAIANLAEAARSRAGGGGVSFDVVKEDLERRRGSRR